MAEQWTTPTDQLVFKLCRVTPINGSRPDGQTDNHQILENIERGMITHLWNYLQLEYGKGLYHLEVFDKNDQHIRTGAIMEVSREPTRNEAQKTIDRIIRAYWKKTKGYFLGDKDWRRRGLEPEETAHVLETIPSQEWAILLPSLPSGEAAFWANEARQRRITSDKMREICRSAGLDR